MRKSIRVNTLKISVAHFKKEAKKLGWELEPIPWCESGFWIEREDRSKALGKSLLHLLGYFYIQEASSMIPPEILKPQKDDIILDMSSAPGSKTTQIAGLMKNSGIIVANEPEGSRIKALHSNIERLGVANTLISQKDGRAFAEYFSNFFDKILVDAPCSGEGTIRKDPSALEHWNEKRVNVMSRLQKDLITHAFMALKPGGEMVYSTCTLSPEEDEEVVEFLLDVFEGNAELVHFKLTSSKRSFDKLRMTEENQKNHNEKLRSSGMLKIWPQTYDTEGFFIAKIKKNSPTELGSFQNTRRNSPFVSAGKGTFSWIDSHLQKLFGEEDITKYISKNQFFQRGDEIWIRPEKFEHIAQKITINRGGIFFCKRHKEKFQITHEGAMFLIQSGFIPAKSIVDITEDELDEYMKGKDIPSNLSDDSQVQKSNYVFIRYKKSFLGIAKIIGNKIKNLLPRNLVH